MFHGQWIPVRRFGVLQSSAGGKKVKLRPIDDFAEAEVNSAFSYVDKLDLRAIDSIMRRLPLRRRLLFSWRMGPR